MITIMLHFNREKSTEILSESIIQLTYSDTNLDPAWQEMTTIGDVHIPFFADMKYLFNKINARYGYVPGEY